MIEKLMAQHVSSMNSLREFLEVMITKSTSLRDVG
jgi:hypothetical protein